MKKTQLVVLALLAVGVFAGAQSLGVASQPAVPDGVVEKGEYSWSQTFGVITLHLSRTGERLFAAVEAQAEGWVGIGFGSVRMADAHIFIGYVQGGTVEMQQHRGRGHSHKVLEDAVELEYSLREEGGKTTMELSVPVDAFVTAGQQSLELIIACSRGDRTRGRHSYRHGLSVEL